MAACSVCGGAERAPAFTKDGYSYVTCSSCGAVALDPLPDEEACRALYDETYFAGAAGGYVDYLADEPLHRLNARARCKLLASLLPAGPGSLIDVGCAAGFFIDESRQLGWRVTGVEASPWAAEEARRRSRARVFATLPEARAASSTPQDAVTFYQVLEHLADPAAALSQAFDCLQPGGFVVIETWDRESWIARLSGVHWQQVTPPSVVHLFSRPDLKRLLANAGLEWHSAQRTSKAVSVGFVTGLLAGKYPFPGRLVAGAVERLRLGKVAIPYKLGDLITVVGRRPADPSTAP